MSLGVTHLAQLSLPIFARQAVIKLYSCILSVRAAMQVRLRALDGRSPRPESLMDRKEAKRAKATRLAAVDVVSESGIPADRGSFGA